jgi:coenzyme F420-reducing hydrogenase alpha subunit
VHVPILARVEGEGALHLRIRGNVIEELRLRIYEPPRLFEKFLEGRHYSEIPDLVARICGICPVAYQVSAANAIESLFGVELEPQIRALRRLLYCGEWIESHALHIHMLAAPDYFGYDSVIAMARDHHEVVERGLRLHALGNAIMTMLGARAVHPVGLCIGGMHRAPTEAEVAAMLERIEAALAAAAGLVAWCAEIAVPASEQQFVSVGLRAEQGYGIEAGRIVSDRGLDIAASAYEDHFAEEHVPYSTALWSALDGKPYLVGPLARMNLNFDRLPAELTASLAQTGIRWPSSNMFHSMTARAAEIYYALLEARRLMTEYRSPKRSTVAVSPRPGVGYGVSEAPRGVLWHRYEFDVDGRVVSARIVPPTSQNQARIEEDLHASLLAFGLDHDEDALRLHCEKVIRNYDPCISCATHFLRLTTERL